MFDQKTYSWEIEARRRGKTMHYLVAGIQACMLGMCMVLLLVAVDVFRGLY